MNKLLGSLLFLLFLPAGFAYADITVFGSIDSDTFWSPENGVYILGPGVSVSPGVTLTIEPGTIVKAEVSTTGFSTGIQIFGSLVVNGTAAKPVYFTSINDDVGGDTNGDGSATQPFMNSWTGLTFWPGSQGLIQNSVEKYSGAFDGSYRAGIFVYGGDVSIEGSTFENNFQADIYQTAGTLSIKNSRFYKDIYAVRLVGGTLLPSSGNVFEVTAFSNETSNEIDLRNNWWGSTEGPAYVTNPSSPGSYLYGPALIEPWLMEAPSIEPKRTPVIIVPGIIGSELHHSDNLIWLNIVDLFDINDEFLSILRLDEMGNSINQISVEDILDDINVDWKGKSIKLKDIFSGLLRDLQADHDVVIFPYDWRLNLDTIDESLKQKIDEVKASTGSPKVNIVAHSMGGLLVKSYMREYGKDSIDKLIFVGTPHLGAPKAGKVLIEGDTFGIPWLEKKRIAEIAENSPALYQLLPSQFYFNQYQGYLKRYSLFENTDFLNYQETKAFFLDKGKNPLMFQLAESFHIPEIDDLDSSDLDAYNIIGCKTSTQSAYGLSKNGDIAKVGYTSGDGTVPFVSAQYINLPTEHKFYVRNAEHSELPSTDGVRELILSILDDDDIRELESNISNNSDFCNFKGKNLTWRSPVEVHIYDELGNHTGPIENNGIEYGISGVDYDIIGHEKFIFLPTDNGQHYKVEAYGTDSGTFDLLISENDNGEVIKTNVFNDVPVNISTHINLEVSDSSNDEEIEVQVDGLPPKTISESALLIGEAGDDIVAPETQIILSGKEYKDGEFKKEVNVTLNPIDMGSGVFKTYYSLDGTNFIIYNNSFTLGTEGIYNIKYYSVDRAGNNEEIKNMEVIIGKLSKILRKIE